MKLTIYMNFKLDIHFPNSIKKIDNKKKIIVKNKI